MTKYGNDNNFPSTRAWCKKKVLQTDFEITSLATGSQVGLQALGCDQSQVLTMNPFTYVVFAFHLYCCNADIYMHNPRGTNNRLNERSAERRNANRLFDSQVN